MRLYYGVTAWLTPLTRIFNSRVKQDELFTARTQLAAAQEHIAELSAKLDILRKQDEATGQRRDSIQLDKKSSDDIAALRSLLAAATDDESLRQQIQSLHEKVLEANARTQKVQQALQTTMQQVSSASCSCTLKLFIATNGTVGATLARAAVIYDG